ncbi:hypothetical protein AALP_AA8G397700 [Arabis alpina]|uniref:Uncharacterized protein n=1 Tax=Arabis alpina TaxID=50452 RepID=A0A087GCE4_ARAAL|nr:hypothetical protein AALP_AA8G397700 [Arabis alpina]
MEKDLLDISGEDEDNWLLKSTSKKGVTFAGREMSYMDCLPLQIPKSNRPPFSPIGGVKGSNNMEQLSASVNTDSVGKENIGGIKFELPKLSVERQQMKKKKKNAGFNLRKSLAWDRAFSTEEGVLDPVELSKITGNACQTGGDLLPPIQEESMSASKCTSVSPGLRALEENLFNDLPVKSKSREKKKVSGMLSKYASPSKAQSSSAQRKVIPAQDLRSSTKRSGCPRPPPPSSLKRPANVHTTTPQGRELSISKVSTTKSDQHTVANNTKRTTQNPSKPKQSQPTQSKNSHRSLGSVSFSNSTSSTKNKTKSSLASKSSIPKPSFKQTRTNVVSKSSEVPSVSNSQHFVAGKSNVGPKTTTDVAMLSHTSNFSNSNVNTIGTSLAQSSCSRVGNTQSAVSRLGKPSGLRAPSPSIGYFSQSESQPSHSGGDKDSQLTRTSFIPTYKKTQVAEKVPCVTSKSATGNIDSLGPAAGFSSKSILPRPSQVRVKSTREVESKVSSCSLSSRVNETVQHPCIIQGDTRKLVLDDVAICTSEKVFIANCEEFQSNSELPPLDCPNNVEDGNRDEKRKTCCSVEEHNVLLLKHGPTFKDPMDSPVQGPSGDELALINDCSELKGSNPGEKGICVTNDFKGDVDALDVHGQSLIRYVPGNEDEIGLFLSGEKAVLVVDHSTENVAMQPQALDSFTAVPTLLEDFASENQFGNRESVCIPSGPGEAPKCVQSPCNHPVENAESNSILCSHNTVCDGQAVLETEKIAEVSNIIETNCETICIGPLPDCKYWLRESEEQQFSCQSILEGKEGSHDLDVFPRNERADKDDGLDMQIDDFTGTPDAEQNIEQVSSRMPSSAEVRMEDIPLESSHKPSSEKLTSEKHKQYNCSSVANTSYVKADQIMKQSDQFGASNDCSPAKDVSGAVFSYSNEEFEDNSELEDMDLVTESDCSDEESEGNLELIEVDLATESELKSDLDDFSVKGIICEEYLEVETLHTDSDLCGKTKTLLSESTNSSASIFGDHERLNEDKDLSRVSEDVSKEDSSSGHIEHKYVEKAKTQTDTEEDLRAHVTDQELGPCEEEEVQATKISPDPVAYSATVEKSGSPIPMNETISEGDVMQPNEFNVLSDDTMTSESNGAHAFESSSSCTCESEGNDQITPRDEKKPNPIIVKPPNAVPFSDEWLATIEAAGEEILTLKSGRVQHSPTDKSAPEPGPWSPVKRKNNQVVGPFDCTKYTNKGLPPALD